MLIGKLTEESMAKNLIQLGFRLERNDHEWFKKECERQDVVIATVLSAYIKKCRELGTIDPFYILANNTVNNGVNDNANTNANKDGNTEQLTELVKTLVMEHLSNANNDVNQTVNKVVNDLNGNQETINNFVNERINRLESEIEQLNQVVNNHVSESVNNNEDVNNHVSESVNNNEDELVNSEANTSDYIEDEYDHPIQSIDHEEGVRTMTQSEMVKHLEVKQPTLNYWVKHQKWDKLESIPKYKTEGWSWNPNNAVFERVSL